MMTVLLWGKYTFLKVDFEASTHTSSDCKMARLETHKVSMSMFPAKVLCFHELVVLNKMIPGPLRRSSAPHTETKQE
jgi:hypothetical protein